MPQIVSTQGFEGYSRTVNDCVLNKIENIFVLFSGSIDYQTGKSWCSDCDRAAPVIQSAFQSAPDSSVLIYVDVGCREAWKDPNNLFRTDARTKLKSIPTLIKVGTPLKLEEAQCAQKTLAEMVFQEDD